MDEIGLEKEILVPKKKISTKLEIQEENPSKSKIHAVNPTESKVQDDNPKKGTLKRMRREYDEDLEALIKEYLTPFPENDNFDQSKGNPNKRLRMNLEDHP